MSECRTLAEVRENIDRLDREIVRLIAERSGYVRQAAVLKTTRESIVDRERIEDIIARMRTRARELGLDPEIAETVYRTMIDQFIAYETEEYDHIHGARSRGEA